VLDGCTVGTTWELLSLLRDAQGLSGKTDVRCKSNARRGKLSSPRVLNLVSRLVVHGMPGSSARWWLGRFVFVNQQNSQVEPWNKKLPELKYTYPFFPPTPPFSFPPLLYTPTESWSRNHVTCTKQHFSFQNTPDNLHNFVLSLWASFRYNCIIMLTFRMSIHSQLTAMAPKGRSKRKGKARAKMLTLVKNRRLSLDRNRIKWFI